MIVAHSLEGASSTSHIHSQTRWRNPVADAIKCVGHVSLLEPFIYFMIYCEHIEY